MAADKGTTTIYLHGAAGDTFVKQGTCRYHFENARTHTKEGLAGGRWLSFGLRPAAVQGCKNRAGLLGKDLPPRQVLVDYFFYIL